MTQAEIMTTYLRWLQGKKLTSELVIGVSDQRKVLDTLNELKDAGIVTKFEVGKYQATVTMGDK